MRSKLLMYQILGHQIPNHNGKLGLVDPKLFILSSLVCASWDFLVPSCFRFLLLAGSESDTLATWSEWAPACQLGGMGEAKPG